jgi:hypothetical protein
MALSFPLLLTIAGKIASQRDNFTFAISVASTHDSAAPLRVLLSEACLIHCEHVLDAEIASRGRSQEKSRLLQRNASRHSMGSSLSVISVSDDTDAIALLTTIRIEIADY